MIAITVSSGRFYARLLRSSTIKSSPSNRMSPHYLASTLSAFKCLASVLYHTEKATEGWHCTSVAALSWLSKLGLRTPKFTRETLQYDVMLLEVLYKTQCEAFSIETQRLEFSVG